MLEAEESVPGDKAQGNGQDQRSSKRTAAILAKGGAQPRIVEASQREISIRPSTSVLHSYHFPEPAPSAQLGCPTQASHHLTDHHNRVMIKCLT